MWMLPSLKIDPLYAIAPFMLNNAIGASTYWDTVNGAIHHLSSLGVLVG